MAKAVGNRESLHPRQARLRRRNENGLAESENGDGPRKVFGCWHIAGARAERLDRLDGQIRVPYLNGLARACSRPGRRTPRAAAQVLPAGRHPHTVRGAESAAGGRAVLVREVRLAALRPLRTSVHAWKSPLTSNTDAQL